MTHTNLFAINISRSEDEVALVNGGIAPVVVGAVAVAKAAAPYVTAAIAGAAGVAAWNLTTAYLKNNFC